MTNHNSPDDFKAALQQIKSKLNTQNSQKSQKRQQKQASTKQNSNQSAPASTSGKQKKNQSKTPAVESMDSLLGMVNTAAAKPSEKSSSTNSQEGEPSFASLLAEVDDSEASHIKPIKQAPRHEAFDLSAQLKSKKIRPTRVQKLNHEDGEISVSSLSEMEKTAFSAELLTYGESISYLKDGFAPQLLKQMRRGAYRTDLVIDLHGLFLKEATKWIHRELNTAKANQERIIKIIHGKGKHSKNTGPVLKSMLNQQLRLRDDVIAFCSAAANDGGTGALYCLLSK